MNTISKNILFILFIGLLISACSSHRTSSQTIDFYRPEQYALTRSLLASSSMISKPIPIDSSKLYRILAGKPVETQLAKHSLHVENFRASVAGKPDEKFPGKNDVQLPVVFTPAIQPQPATLVQSFQSRDMVYRIPNPFSFASFGRLQGLSGTIVSCLFTDKEGNQWMGTSTGVTMYDGNRYTNYTTDQGLVFNDVRAMLQDRMGNIWFGTLGGGISKYDGRQFFNYRESDGLCGDFIVSIVEDEGGGIWFGSLGGGASRFDGLAFTNYSVKQGLAGDSINCMVPDQAGNIWFGTQHGISKFNGSSFVNYTKKQGLSNNRVYGMARDKNGKMWIGTFGNGISIFDGSSFSYLNSGNGLVNDDILTLCVSDDGTVWIGTHYGLCKYKNGIITSYGEDDGITNSNIYSISQDHSGNIWIGTGGGGAMKFEPNSFTHLTENEGLTKNYVFSIFEDHSRKLWIGYWRGGVSQIDGNILKTFTTRQGLLDNDIRSINQDEKGNLWLATFKGVVKFDGRSFTNYTKNDGLSDNDVNCITHDSRGNFWFGTENGATKYDGHSFTNFFTKEPGIRVNSIKEDNKGNIWFGTSSGIFEYDGIYIVQLKGTLRKNDLNVSEIMQGADGMFWFATNHGLLNFDGEKITFLTKREGLPENEITSILEDKQKNIWAGTRSGLSQLTPQKARLLLRRLKEKKIFSEDVFFKNYDYNDNFLGVGTNQRTIIETSDHQLKIGTPNGLSSLDLSKTVEKLQSPSANIINLKIANQSIDWNIVNQNEDTLLLAGNEILLHDFHFKKVAKWSHLPIGLSLAWDNNNITIEYACISTAQAPNIQYNYRLEGPYHNAANLTNQTSVTYGNLPPGNYTFHVKARNYPGIWSNEAVYSFTIRSPWWQTWWFRISAMLVFGYMVFFSTRFLYRYRMQKQKSALEKKLALQFERQRISSDLHDEIGSTLSSINIYSNLAKSNESKSSYLDAISANVTDVINKLDDLVWKLNPKYDSLESVIARLILYAEPLAQARGIYLSFPHGKNLADIHLSDDTKHNLYLILKELINNAFKHASCQHITLNVVKYDGNMAITLADDGTGIAINNTASQRSGLQNVTHRIENIKGTMTTTSGDAGTTIHLNLPLA